MKKAFFWVILVALFLIVSEFLGQIFYRVRYGEFLFKKQFHHPHTILFQAHPWLVGSLSPDASVRKGNVRISNNLHGFRGKPFELKKNPSKIRIVTYGGSSTYCTGVSDQDTWPAQLEDALGAEYEVINASAPGYSSVEAVIQTALQQFDLEPDIVIYYLGWNDLPYLHVPNLKSDYSDFHGAKQFYNLGLHFPRPEGRFFLPIVFDWIRRRLFFNASANNPPQSLESAVTERTLAIYRHHLKTLIHLSRSRGIKILMAPQVLNYSSLTSDEPYGWASYAKRKDIKQLMVSYNDVMKVVCREEKIPCAEAALNASWKEEHFIDEGHFTERGNNQFAFLIADAVRALT